SVSLLQNPSILQGNRLFRLGLVGRALLEGSVTKRHFRLGRPAVLGTSVTFPPRLLPHRDAHLDEAGVFGEKATGLLPGLEEAFSRAAPDRGPCSFFLLLVLLGIGGRTIFVLVLALVFLPAGPVRVGSGRLRLIVRRLLLGRFLLLPGRLLAGALLLFPFLGLRHIELNPATGLTRLFFLLAVFLRPRLRFVPGGGGQSFLQLLQIVLGFRQRFVIRLRLVALVPLPVILLAFRGKELEVKRKKLRKRQIQFHPLFGVIDEPALLLGRERRVFQFLGESEELRSGLSFFRPGPPPLSLA